MRRRVLELGFTQWLTRFETGEVTSSDFAELITAPFGLSLSDHEFARDWEDIFWLNEPVSRLIVVASRGGIHADSGFKHQSLACGVFSGASLPRHSICLMHSFFLTKSAT